MISPSSIPEVGRQAEGEPAGRHADHGHQGQRAPSSAEHVRRHVGQPVPFHTLLGGGEGDGRRRGQRRWPPPRPATPTQTRAGQRRDQAHRSAAPPTSGDHQRRRPAGRAAAWPGRSGRPAARSPRRPRPAPARTAGWRASATATAAAKAAQGSTVRADRQDTVRARRDGALGLEHDVDDHRADHQRADHRDVRVGERLHQVAGGPALAPVPDQPLELARGRRGPRSSIRVVVQGTVLIPRGALPSSDDRGWRPSRPAPARGWRRRSPAPAAARPSAARPARPRLRRPAAARARP